MTTETRHEPCVIVGDRYPACSCGSGTWPCRVEREEREAAAARVTVAFVCWPRPDVFPSPHRSLVVMRVDPDASGDTSRWRPGPPAGAERVAVEKVAGYAETHARMTGSTECTFWEVVFGVTVSVRWVRADPRLTVRYGLCGPDCTVDCGHCKGAGRPVAGRG